MLQHYDGVRAGIRELEFQLACLVQRVDIDNHEAGTQHGCHRYRILQHVRHHEGDAGAALKPLALKPGGEGTRGLIDLAIGHGPVHADEGVFVAMVPETFLEHRDQCGILRRVNFGGNARRVVSQPRPFHEDAPSRRRPLYGPTAEASASNESSGRARAPATPDYRSAPPNGISGLSVKAARSGRSSAAAPTKASNSSRTVRSGRSRVMNTRRLRWSSSGQCSSRAVGWNTCCTPCTTTGVSGISASFTMPLIRNSLLPWVARSSSRNISSVPAGIETLLVSTKARMCSSWRFTS